jgi:hypothetical protein
LDFEHFEGYIQYLHHKPLINYILRNLKYHIDRSCQVANISCLISQFVEELLVPENPAAILFGTWAFSNLSDLTAQFGNKLISASPPRLSRRIKDAPEPTPPFIDRLLHTAADMSCTGVAEALLVVGARVDVYL